MSDVTRAEEALVDDEIAELERRLLDARARKQSNGVLRPTSIIELNSTVLSKTSAAQHYLLLLSDSALPLGSFAFSGGLESYLAHTKPRSSFSTFLSLSLSSYASTTLPYVLAAYRNPELLAELDDTFDATIMCTVGRRASVAQGRALLSIWDKSICTSITGDGNIALVEILKAFSASLRSTSIDTSNLPIASAHLGPLFGAIARILGLELQQTAYVFMLSHVKALLSAAVRASMFGPYHAQKLLAGAGLQAEIQQAIVRHWGTKIEDAGQTMPVIDLWVGRHEMLYSRIFNS